MHICQLLSTLNHVSRMTLPFSPMLDSYEILSQFATLDVFRVKCTTGTDLKGWIANQGYNFLSKDTSGFSVKAYHSDDMISSLTNDYNKMAIGAYESACGVRVEEGIPKSTSWVVIRLYYASFFAAHALLRAFGRSCTQLDQVHINKIQEIANLTSASKISLEKGFYLVRIDQANDILRFVKLKDSHRDTWESFLSLLNELIVSVNSARGKAEDIIKTKENIQAMKSCLSAQGCGSKGNWLSFIRNNVNYQHKYNTWFPHSKRVDAKRLVESVASKWCLPLTACAYDNSLPEVEMFTHSAVAIVSFLKEFSAYCSLKVNAPKSTTMQYSQRLLNLIVPAA